MRSVSTQGEPIQQKFGDAVRLRLHDLDRSQSWLARRFGVTPQAVSEWLNIRIPSRERVFAIEDELGMRGQLSAIAGYVRPDHPEPATFEDFVNADPALAERDRDALIALYRSLRRDGGSHGR